MRKALIAAIIAGLVVLAIWIGGIRIFIIQPIGMLPEGATVIVANVRGLRFIDSPDAVCEREGQPNLLCRGAVIGRVGQVGTIVARLPYSDVLYGLTGAAR